MSRSRRPGSVFASAASALFFVTAVAGIARAQSPEETATARFRQGAEAYARKDFRAAALAFESADSVLHAGATMYNAALAWVAAGDSLHAANDFAQAIELGGLSAPQATDAAQRLEAIDRDVGRLEVAGPAGAKVTIDGTTDALVPAHLRVSVGGHVVTITRADGSTEAKRTHVAKGSSARVEFGQSAVSEPPEPVPPPEKPAEPVTKPPSRPPPAEEPAGTGSSVQRTLGWVGMGAGVGMSVVAIVSGAVGLGTRNAFVAGYDHDASEHDRAITLRTVANVSWVAAGVLAAGGVVLFVTAPKGGPAAQRTEPSAEVSLGPGSFVLRGSF